MMMRVLVGAESLPSDIVKQVTGATVPDCSNDSEEDRPWVDDFINDEEATQIMWLWKDLSLEDRKRVAAHIRRLWAFSQISKKGSPVC